MARSDGNIVIHAGGARFPIALPSGGKAPPRYLEQQAVRWSYVVRARERWIDSPEARARHEESARATLELLGIGQAALQAMAGASTVVVRIAYFGEEQDWAARLFPWEYVLPAATRRLRAPQAREFTVMRELLPGGQPAAIAMGTQPVLLFVQSAPGRLADGWSFDDELERVRRGLAGGWQVRVLANPTLDELRARLESDRPALVHLTGFDNVQGLRNLREAAGAQTLVDVPAGLLDLQADDGPVGAVTLARVLKDERALQDGYLMTSDGRRPRVVPALELASTLSGLAVPPLVVGVSLANSASRTAALLVGEGAAANAVGFQGGIDNAAADYFFETFYGQLLAQRGDIAAAFPAAWTRVRSEPHARRGSGIALWSSWDLLRPLPRREAAGADRTRGAGEPTLDVQPADELNYAVLHNSHQGLFKRFVVDGNGVKAGQRISVDVCVQLGPETASYASTFVAKPGEQRWNLTDAIHVPLTAGLVRSSRETVNSSVSVQLKLDDALLERQSHKIRLLPVDQWRDNSRDGQWLPSFVLPRDPAVMRAVQQAQRYVRVLRDDPTAGFEGYQVASELEPQEEELLEVDLQVQAIWSTLVHDWRLGYINPPPGYSAQLDSQRLRTPSQVERNAAGTCIDLALLLAACLELVDIYPVVFLLEGHALPGYWRHQSYHEEFLQATFKGAVDPEAGVERPRSSADVQTYPWQAIGRDAHKELAARIRARQLVPIETVRLTENSGFVNAIEAGTQALSQARDFHSLLDIVQARVHGVTPLPVVEAEA
jgi:hypothetical protein